MDSFNCTCVLGYGGDRCQTDIDDCLGHKCSNGATCEDRVNAYNCKCVAGYSGVHCGDDKDECTPNPCLQKGSRCTESGTSKLVALDRFSCTCAAGWEGQVCEDDADECASSPCKNGGTCDDSGTAAGVGVNAFRCKCRTGFGGDNCGTPVNPCAAGSPKPSGCHAKADCLYTGPGENKCTCSTGYSDDNGNGGRSCSDIDECATKPCKNGGRCLESGASQTVAPGKFICKCSSYWTGHDCGTDVNECAVSNGGCDVLQTCTNNQGRANTCGSCPSFAPADSKGSCVVEGSCQGQKNPATSQPYCDANATCTRNKATTAVQCACRPGYRTLKGGVWPNGCEDIDECASSPCMNSGLCTNAVNYFACKCETAKGNKTGWEGATCQTDTDECSSKPCRHGKCYDSRTPGKRVPLERFSCTCDAGWSGATCATNIDECAKKPCKNGGTCTDLEQHLKYQCACPDTHDDANCSTPVNPCLEGAKLGC